MENGELPKMMQTQKRKPQKGDFQRPRVRFFFPEYQEGLHGKPYCPRCSKINKEPTNHEKAAMCAHAMLNALVC